MNSINDSCKELNFLQNWPLTKKKKLSRNSFKVFVLPKPGIVKHDFLWTVLVYLKRLRYEPILGEKQLHKLRLLVGTPRVGQRVARFNQTRFFCVELLDVYGHVRVIVYEIKLRRHARCWSPLAFELLYSYESRLTGEQIHSRQVEVRYNACIIIYRVKTQWWSKLKLKRVDQRTHGQKPVLTIVNG